MPEDYEHLSDAALLARRNKAIAASRSVLSVANAEGRLVTGEERQNIERSQSEAADCQHELDERAQGGGRGAPSIADTEYLEQQRSRFVSGGTINALGGQVARVQGNLAAYNAKPHIRFLRGDKSVYGGGEIAFSHADLRGDADSVPVYRVDDNANAEMRALGSGSASAGSTIDSPFVRRLYDYKETYSTFRALMPTRLTTSTGAPTTWPYVSLHGATDNESDVALPEFAAIGGTDATFDKLEFGAFKAGQILPSSNELRVDNAVDIEAWIITELQRNAMRQEDRWFFRGTGTNMPQGILNAGFEDAVDDADHEALSFGDIARTVGSLDQSYGNLRVYTPQAADGMAMPRDLCWLMSATTLVEVWLITDGDGRFIFQEQLSKGVHDTLLGFKVVTSPFMPTIAADTTVAYFGSFGDAMVMREAGTTSLVWSDHSSFDKDARDYRITCRVDSKVRDTRAVRGLKTAAA